MSLIIALCVAPLITGVCHTWLKKYSILFYLGAAVLSAVVVAGKLPASPAWADVTDLLTRGTLATAMFVLGMYAGALPKNGKLTKALMTVRAELSIIACILTLGHNIYCIQVFSSLKRQATDAIPSEWHIAKMISCLLMFLMIPLFLTSFKIVRKRMKAKTWKRIQRLAYVFYGLLYAHVMVLMVPNALEGKGKYVVSVVVYTSIYAAYVILKIKRFTDCKKYTKYTK